MENQILEAADKMFSVILKNYGIELKHKTTIRFDLKGRCAGTATHLVNEEAFIIRLNKEAGLDFLLNDTLPHEMAHILEAAFGGKMSHGRAWEFYCKELGGTSLMYHTLDLTPARKTRMFLYVVNGEDNELTIIRHNRIQNKGMEYKSCNTGNVIQKEHFIRELI
jgi:predicted SprT family Zn-dependent metalloprotease